MSKIAEKKNSWCQNRHQGFFQNSYFFTLQKGKLKVTCTHKSRKFYGSNKT